MGRHTVDDDEHESDRTSERGMSSGGGSRLRVRRVPRRLRSHRRSAIWATAAVAAVGAALALTVAGPGEGWWNGPAALPGASAADGGAAGADAGAGWEGCTQVADVWVVAGDGLATALEGLDPASLGPDPDGVCAALRVVGQPEAETAAALASGLDSRRRADVWVPDSSLWAERAQRSGVEVEAVGSLGTSPVVVASSPEAVAASGWSSQPPTWADVLGGDLPLAVPDLQDSSSAVLALAAARSTGSEEEDGLLTVRAVLARQQVGSLTPSEGLALAAGGGADAPLVLTSEQDVLRRTAGATVSLLQAVAPRDSTAVLDYPVLAVPGVQDREPADAAAVRLVLDALSRAPGRAVGAVAGLRGPSVSPVPGVPPLVEVAEPYVYPEATAIATVVADLERLAPATQLLVVVDVSRSMSAEIGDGRTRADVAAEALTRALGELPGRTRVSLWQFASSLGPGTDHVEVLPSRPLDAQVDGRSQRELLDGAVSALPGALVDGGTSLYDTTDAAIAAAREQFDPDTVSTVLVITDGRNEDSSGLDLPETTGRLAAGADPARPVGLVAVAFGPDADLEALEQLAAAAGGGSQAVSARDPEALTTLLEQLLVARTRTPAP